jgi:hypothetical protein
MNGLAQYGVGRGSVDNPIVINTAGGTNASAPTSSDIQTNLENWISNGTNGTTSQ